MTISSTTAADPSASNKQFGALDLGSNSFHLLIAQESHGRLQVLDKHKEMVRLAEGLQPDNSLSLDVIHRALACLERFAQRLRPLDQSNVRIVGTNTLRKAKAEHFVQQAEHILGHKIDIISGREEARLIYTGVCHDLGVDDQNRLVVDIGGGSTELIIGRRSTPQALDSLYMGCVSMAREHFADGRINRHNMQAAIDQALLEMIPIARTFSATHWTSCIGASGTINAVRAVLGATTPTDSISVDALTHLKQSLIDAGSLQALKLVGLSDERKAVFPSGVAILSAIFETLGIEEMRVSDSALREGLIYDLLGRRHADDTRDHTVANLVAHYRIDAAHARRVRETAISLLSQVAGDWAITEAWHTSILARAASLHELGMDISHAGYHKHGGYLLANMDMPGFSRTEQQQLATLVRVHRRKLFSDLFKEDTRELLYLAVLLRLAVVMHRNRSDNALPHIQARAKGEHLTLSLPAHWLEQNPLTANDLNVEADFLNGINVKLRIARV